MLEAYPYEATEVIVMPNFFTVVDEANVSKVIKHTKKARIQH